MRKLFVAGLAVAALLVAGPAFAFRAPDPNAPWPTPHQREAGYADQERQPYATNYSDEAARSLGLTDGRWEAFNSQSAAGATLKGGLDTHGAVLRLQW
ncbi:MAG TPA: hypothetical protein VIG39_02570 [Rhizomicrobium sp.]|jgi:hypothetical protein